MSSRLAEDVLSIKDPQETVDRIKRFLTFHYGRIGAKYLVVGMSGGLDSSITAALCSKAVGGKQVLGLFLPEYETRNANNIKQAKLVAKQFGVKFRLIDITSMIKIAREELSQAKQGTRTIPDANLKARLRMTSLYYFANVYNGLVVGTSDKSEMMLGYFTKYGDGGCDLEPIADIYKTSLRSLGKYLRLPKIILSKPSSPELWPGQTAEKELGASYQKLDLILWGLERWMSVREIADEIDMPLRFVEKIRRRWIAAEHKRRPPMTMKMGFRTSGQDLRIPYSL